MPTSWGRSGDDRLQQFRLLQEMYNKSALGPGETALERALNDVTKEQILRGDLERKQVGTLAKIQEGRERGQQLGEDSASKEQERLEKSARGKEKSEREERELQETIPKLRAETETTRLTGKWREAQTKTEGAKYEGEKEKTAATRDWRNAALVDGIKEDARNAYNGAVANALAGNMSSFQGEHAKENTDALERAGQILNGPGFKLPRDPDGAWQPDLKKIGLTVTNKSGEYNAEFAKNVRDANKSE